MKKRVMIMAICAVIALGLTLPISAQTSNTSVSTAGLFGNDVDDYMSYHDYADVLGEGVKWFGYVTGRGEAGGQLEAGYARNISGIYLGIFYRGFIARSGTDWNTMFNSPADEVNRITPVYDDDLEILLSKTETTTYYDTSYDTRNNINFLIGVSGMGIKVGFFEATKYNKNAGNPARTVTVTDYLDGRKDYFNIVDKYQFSSSALAPSLGWGGTFAVGGLTLKPFVDFSFGIINDTQIDNYSSYTTVNGVKQNIDKNIGAGYEKGYLEPQGTIGVTVDLAPKGTVQTTVGIAYDISFKLYKNNAEGLGKVNGTVAWVGGVVDSDTVYSNRTETATGNTYNIQEISEKRHTITPGYKVTGEPGENFKLGFSAALPITISSWAGNDYTRDISKTKIKYNNGLPGSVTESETITYNWNTESSDFRVSLELALGASYRLIPNRFGINAGISATPITWIQKTTRTIPKTTGSIYTSKTTQDDGTVTANDKTVTLKNEDDVVLVSRVLGQYSATLSGGFTFNFNNNAALDLAVSTDSSNTFHLSLTDVNVLFTFKY